MRRAAGSRWLTAVSLAYLLAASAGAVIAIREHLPGEFAGTRSRRSVAEGFLTIAGTALSPPLALMLAQAALTVLSLRAGRARRVGVRGLGVLGATYVIGHLGEPITYRSFSPATFHAGRAALLSVQLGLAALMAALGLSTWWKQASGQPGSVMGL